MANVKKDKMSFHSRYNDYEFQIPFEIQGKDREQFVNDRADEWDYWDSWAREKLREKGERVEEKKVEGYDAE